MKLLAKLMLTLVLAGMGITAYLAYVHYAGIEAVCPVEPQLNCNAVLNSGYATAIGVPLAVWGFIVYSLLLIALLLHERNKHVKADKILLVLPGVGVFAAGFYSTVMFFRLQVICLWCEASHVIMLVLFIISARHIRPQWSFSRIICWLAALLIIGAVTSFVADSFEKPDSSAENIAECLSEKNAVMYGAYWCPHCKEQKRLFGSTVDKIQYVECADKNNPRIQLEVCKKAGVISYPTWIINGQKISGIRSVEELAELARCSL